MQVAAPVGTLSAVCDKVVDDQADIASDLPEQDRREITPGMDRDGRCAAVRMPEPLVGAPVASLREADASRMPMTSRGRRTGTAGMCGQSTTVCVPT